MKAKDMVQGQWYRLVPNSIGRFVAYQKCSPDSSWAWLIAVDGDTDMQSLEFLAADADVEPAEPKEIR